MGSGGLVGLTKPGDLGRVRDVGERFPDLVDNGCPRTREVDDGPGRSAGHGRRGGSGGLDERLRLEPIRVRVCLRLARDDPDPGPSIEPGDELLDPRVVETDARRSALLSVDLGDVPPRREGFVEDLPHQGLIEHGWGFYGGPRNGTPGAATGCGTVLAVATRAPPSWSSAVWFVLAAGAAILAAYLAHPVIEGHRLPVGPDGPVYTWWTAQGAVDGLQAIPTRPGVPAASIVLGTILATEPLETVSLLGPVLAAICGLAAAGLLESALGPIITRAWAAAVLTGAFSAYLATGWLANLAQVTLLLAAIAALGVAGRSWRPVVLGASLLTGGAIAHLPFHLVGMAILGGGIVALLPEARGDLAAGVRFRDTSVGRITIAAVIGSAAGAVAALSVGASSGRDTSQDAFLRRAGLEDVLRHEYRFRLRTDLRRGSVHLGAGLLLGLFGPRQAWWRDGRRFLFAVLAAWALLTIGGVAVLGLTGLAPGHRLLSFGFFLPAAAAVGLASVLARSGRLLARAGVLALAILFVGGSMYAWYRAEPFMNAGELAVARTAGETIERLPARTPVVFLVDTREPAASFHVTRFFNVIRAGLPADRIRDVRLAVGRPQDYLSGVPTLTGDREHDRLSRISLRDLGETGRQAVTFVLDRFNERGYGRAVDLGGEIAPGIAVLGDPLDVVGRLSRATANPGLGAGRLIGLSVAALVLFAALGGGWAAFGVPGVSSRGVAALAPAVGLAIAILSGFVSDRFGSSDPWGAVAAVVIGAGGYVAVLRRARAG